MSPKTPSWYFDIILYEIEKLREIKEETIRGSTLGKKTFAEINNYLPRLFPECRKRDYFLTTYPGNGYEHGGLWRLCRGINNLGRGLYLFGDINPEERYSRHYIHTIAGKEIRSFRSYEAVLNDHKKLNFINLLEHNSNLFKEILNTTDRTWYNSYKEIVEETIDQKHNRDQFLKDYLEKNSGDVAIILKNGKFSCMRFKTRNIYNSRKLK